MGNCLSNDKKAGDTMKESISITLDKDILEKVRKIAEYDDRSVSQSINYILKMHIAQREKKYNGKLFPD